MPDFPLLITTLENNVYKGITEPPMQSTRSNSALDRHFSVSVMTMNSSETKLSPKSRGKERKAMKRTILRNAFNCRSLSPETSTKTGCITGLSMPCKSK